MLLIIVFFLGQAEPVLGMTRPGAVTRALTGHAGVRRYRSDDGATGTAAKRQTLQELACEATGDVVRTGDIDSESDDSAGASTVGGEAWQRSPRLDVLIAAASAAMGAFDLDAGGGVSEHLAAAPAAGGAGAPSVPKKARGLMTALYAPADLRKAIKKQQFRFCGAIFDETFSIEKKVERLIQGWPTEQRALIFNTLMYRYYTLADDHFLVVFGGSGGKERHERFKSMMQALYCNITWPAFIYVPTRDGVLAKSIRIIPPLYPSNMADVTHEWREVKLSSHVTKLPGSFWRSYGLFIGDDVPRTVKLGGLIIALISSDEA